MADQPITLDDVRRLDVRPGDVVAIRSDRDLTDQERDYLLDTLAEAHDATGVKFILLDGGLTVDSVISPAEATA